MKTLEREINNKFGKYEYNDLTEKEKEIYQNVREAMKKYDINPEDEYAAGQYAYKLGVESGTYGYEDDPYAYFQKEDREEFADTKKKIQELEEQITSYQDKIDEEEDEDVIKKYYACISEAKTKRSAYVGIAKKEAVTVMNKINKPERDAAKKYCDISNKLNSSFTFTRETATNAAATLRNYFQGYQYTYNPVSRFLGHFFTFTEAGKAYQEYQAGVEAFHHLTGIDKNEIEVYAEDGYLYGDLEKALDGTYSELHENIDAKHDAQVEHMFFNGDDSLEEKNDDLVPMPDEKQAARKNAKEFFEAINEFM